MGVKGEHEEEQREGNKRRNGGRSRADSRQAERESSISRSVFQSSTPGTHDRANPPSLPRAAEAGNNRS